MGITRHYKTEGILLPGSGLVMASVYEGGILFAYQISLRYLIPCLR